MEIWGGKARNIEAAQEVFRHRAKMNAAARSGSYSDDVEKAS